MGGLLRDSEKPLTVVCRDCSVAQRSANPAKPLHTRGSPWFPPKGDGRGVLLVSAASVAKRSEAGVLEASILVKK